MVKRIVDIKKKSLQREDKKKVHKEEGGKESGWEGEGRNKLKV